MKIRVHESPEIEEIEVVINCQNKNEQVVEIERSLTYLNKIITGRIDGRSYTLTPHKIYYFDTIENKVFAYTKDKVYDISLKLYQLEEILENTPFIRISKNTILNIKKIRSFESSINGRMDAILLNNEKVVVSRKYVPVLKQILGGGRG
ncbi:MAG: LytTR family transcriptional regulator DNA-binding domain-containing protein [Bacilli bacterium]|nr:LytTR family transcriptional regulator DNA-binding domain-containing protein [Bacilli bacterium]MBN2876075.1 LytTR family transcriptional regulator DNA-binding domain-containing protein [Bacilli bacterium]